MHETLDGTIAHLYHDVGKRSGRDQKRWIIGPNPSTKADTGWAFAESGADRPGRVSSTWISWDGYGWHGCRFFRFVEPGDDGEFPATIHEFEDEPKSEYMPHAVCHMPAHSPSPPCSPAHSPWRSLGPKGAPTHPPTTPYPPARYRAVLAAVFGERNVIPTRQWMLRSRSRSRSQSRSQSRPRPRSLNCFSDASSLELPSPTSSPESPCQPYAFPDSPMSLSSDSSSSSPTSPASSSSGPGPIQTLPLVQPPRGCVFLSDFTAADFISEATPDVRGDDGASVPVDAVSTIHVANTAPIRIPDGKTASDTICDTALVPCAELAEVWTSRDSAAEETNGDAAQRTRSSRTSIVS